jgi:hypothetical protein
MCHYEHPSKGVVSKKSDAVFLSEEGVLERARLARAQLLSTEASGSESFLHARCIVGKSMLIGHTHGTIQAATVPLTPLA